MFKLLNTSTPAAYIQQISCSSTKLLASTSARNVSRRMRLLPHLQCGIVAPGETKNKSLLGKPKAQDGDIEKVIQLLLATNMHNLVLPTER